MGSISIGLSSGVKILSGEEHLLGRKKVWNMAGLSYGLFLLPISSQFSAALRSKIILMTITAFLYTQAVFFFRHTLPVLERPRIIHSQETTTQIPETTSVKPLSISPSFPGSSISHRRLASQTPQPNQFSARPSFTIQGMISPCHRG